MLESNEGPKLMEVNSSPGFEGLEKATGLDMASELVHYVAEYAQRWKDSAVRMPVLVPEV